MNKGKLSFIFIVAIAMVLACSKHDSKVIKRDGEPDYIRTDDDKEMNAAIEQARKSIDRFIAALESHSTSQKEFSVKKAFTDGKTTEYIWLANVTFDGKAFHGEVGNEPVDVKTIKLGEKTLVSREHISDWMFVEDGKLVGGYTVRVLYSHSTPEEKKDFQEHVDFKIE